MTFTDDDLKRLKEDLKECYYHPSKFDCDALIARLEAAEAALKMLLEIDEESHDDSIDPASPMGKLLEAWRKAAGK